MRSFLAALLLFTTLLAAALLCSPASLAQAQAPATPTPSAGAIQLNATAGFGGVGRVGGWVPVSVDVVNQGAQTNATLQVVVQQQASRGSLAAPYSTYTLPVTLPRASHKRFSLDAYLSSANDHWTAQLVGDGNAMLAQQDGKMTRVSPGAEFCGVMSRDPSAYDFLMTLDLPAPDRRVQTTALDPASIPAHAPDLASLDCLIIDNASTSQLGADQLDALQIWIANGGLLIAVGGPAWQTALSPLPAGLLPVDVTGLKQVQSLDSLGDLVQSPLDGGGPWLVTQGRARLDQGARIVAAQDGTPIVAAETYGDGGVLYLAFDPTAQAMRTWSGDAQLWRYLLAHSVADSGIVSPGTQPTSIWGRPPRMAMADFSQQPRPVFTWLAVLIGGYAAALGGVLFVCGRHGLLRQAVMTSIALPVIAGGIAFQVSHQQAQADLAVNRVSVLRPAAAMDGVPGLTHAYLSLVTRADGNVSLVLPGGDLLHSGYYPFPRPTTTSDSGWSVQVEEGEQTALQGLQLRQGQLATTVTDGQIHRSPAVLADLQIENGIAQGVIANHTGGRITDASLVLDDQVTALGTLERDEQRVVQVPLPEAAGTGTSGSPSFVQNLLHPDSPDDPVVPARRDWLQSLFSTRFSAQRLDLHGLNFVGWLEHSPESATATDLQLSTEDLALLIQPIQPKLPAGFEGQIPASAMDRQSAGPISAAALDRPYYSLAPGDTLNLQFSLPPADGLFKLEELRLNVGGSVGTRRTEAQVPFTVSLFNWQTTQWDSWTVAAGPNDIPAGTTYVSALGNIRLRYALDPSLGQNVQEVRLTRLDITPVGSVS